MGRTPPQSSARATDSFSEAVLQGLVSETLVSIERALGDDPATRRVERPHRRELALLGALVRMQPGVVRPVSDPRAPLAHACPEVERALHLGAGESLALLEGLAELGLLARELENRVHVCRACARAAINFRECCADCGSLEIALEPVLHHYRCAYTGLQREFEQELRLVCPKCRRELHQIGRDFERPHETYVCRACRALFEEPRLEAQCLACRALCPASEVPARDIHRYRPTALAAEAVAEGRLTELSVGALFFDEKLRLDTRGLLLLEARRETERLRRHGVPFSVAVLAFEGAGRRIAIFRDWDARRLAALGERLSLARSPLDVVARLDEARIGLLLPQTDAAGTAALRARLLERLAGLGHEGELVPVWDALTCDRRETEFEDLRRYLEGTA